MPWAGARVHPDGAAPYYTVTSLTPEQREFLVALGLEHLVDDKAVEAGAFDESGGETLSSTDGLRATFQVQRPLEELGGSYDFPPDIDPSEYQENRVSFSGEVDAAGSSGHVGGVAEGKDEGGGIGSSTAFEVAEWSSP